MNRRNLQQLVLGIFCTLVAFGAAGQSQAADARTAFNYIYTTQIQTGSVNYQAFRAWADGDISQTALDVAFTANLSARAAFFEAVDIKNGEGGSWRTVQRHLRDAISDLEILIEFNLPREMARTTKSALSYARYAKGLVDQLVD